MQQTLPSGHALRLDALSHLLTRPVNRQVRSVSDDIILFLIMLFCLHLRLAEFNQSGVCINESQGLPECVKPQKQINHPNFIVDALFPTTATRFSTSLDSSDLMRNEILRSEDGKRLCN